MSLRENKWEDKPPERAILGGGDGIGEGREDEEGEEEEEEEEGEEGDGVDEEEIRNISPKGRLINADNNLFHVFTLNL